MLECFARLDVHNKQTSNIHYLCKALNFTWVKAHILVCNCVLLGVGGGRVVSQMLVKKVFVGPYPHMGMDYCIRSNFWNMGLKVCVGHHPFIHPSVHSFEGEISFIHPSIHPFIWRGDFIHPSIHSFEGEISFIHSSIHSFEGGISSIHPSIHSFVRGDFIHPSIHLKGGFHSSIHTFFFFFQKDGWNWSTGR